VIVKRCAVLFFAVQCVMAQAFAAPQPVELALTVDDLPAHGALPAGMTRSGISQRMIAVLKKHKIRDAAAFINAGHIQSADDEKVIPQWKAAGFLVANHSYTHPSLNKTPLPQWLADVGKDDAFLLKLHGSGPAAVAPPWKWFRYPFLIEGNTVEKREGARHWLAEHGYRIAQVTVDFEDWAWNQPYARCLAGKDKAALRWLRGSYLDQAVARLRHAVDQSRALFQRVPGQVLLLHIGAFDAAMLDDLLTRYEKEGVRFVDLATAQRVEVYAIDPKVLSDGGETLWSQHFIARKTKAPPVPPLPLQDLERVCM
jgi:peptidoglycan/xylan/chitin deacetylase (PgdA/CDA1 family)